MKTNFSSHDKRIAKEAEWQMRDFLAEMDALINNEQTEIEVAQSEFLDFQKVWVNYDHRKEIVGEAQRNGAVIYRKSENGIV